MKTLSSDCDFTLLVSLFLLEQSRQFGITLASRVVTHAMIHKYMFLTDWDSRNNSTIRNCLIHDNLSQKEDFRQISKIRS